ncbi:hypothetical protein THAOC_13124 [Thalassiosira oceanica]|uniref:Uncharacterized protein n=1 Tax=Thalassiosira oceanica TaxID=159749 RepID=K0SY87_THAOC|nr:hypothetical protein THAOC_13124 [Thalassiosira oceanica]|eukprot:EJK65976.1 hypothetical protein THAOC_13124 [Thalassiosira oceanica]
MSTLDSTRLTGLERCSAGFLRHIYWAFGGVPLTSDVSVVALCPFRQWSISGDRRAQQMQLADNFTPKYILDLHPWCTSGQYWPLSAPPVSRDTTRCGGSRPFLEVLLCLWHGSALAGSQPNLGAEAAPAADRWAVRPEPTVTRCSGHAGWSTAVSGHTMRGGRHFVEFLINKTEGFPAAVCLGIMRPVSLTDGIDLEADWGGDVDPVVASSSYIPP